jgi:hypothetical protein
VAVNYTFAENSPNTSSIGWVLEHHLAAFVKQSDEDTVRRLLPQRADGLLGFMYFWGGRSAFNYNMFLQKVQLTGLDCSGLTSISYRSLGKFGDIFFCWPFWADCCRNHHSARLEQASDEDVQSDSCISFVGEFHRFFW